MPKPQAVVFILSISFVFLVLQFYGIKYLYEHLKSTKPVEERVPWEAVKLFLRKCEHSGLPVFVVEPNLIRAVREGSKRRVELWNMENHKSVTFGVLEPGLDQLHLVMSAMKHENYEFWEKNYRDPRGISVLRRSYRVVPTHYLLWVPARDHIPMLIHLVVFYKRGEFYWHSSITDKEQPYSLEGSPFSSTEGTFSLFNISNVYIDEMNIHLPSDSFTFLKEIENSEFIECNYTRAFHFFAEYPSFKQEGELFKRKGRQLLVIAKQILDSMGIPFWLSSGTCLGWFRQCDLIPYSKDVDLGIFIKDYREELISLLEGAGLALTHQFGKVSDSFELSFMYGDVKLDIFFFYVTHDYIWNGGTQASTGKKYKYIFPPFHLCWTEFLELWIRVPCPAEPYIHANYGPKWMIPIPGWDWKASPNNVIENGQWPKKEWNEVIQLYE